MLPISITMFATAAAGARLSNRFAVRPIVQTGLIVTLAGALVLLGRSRPRSPMPGSPSEWPSGYRDRADDLQLGNVVQSSVNRSVSEAGGLRYRDSSLVRRWESLSSVRSCSSGLPARSSQTSSTISRISSENCHPSRGCCWIQYQLRRFHADRGRSTQGRLGQCDDDGAG